MGKPVTVNDLRCGHGLHETLFHARYQNAVKFAMMFEASPRWSGTDEKDMIEHLMPFRMDTYFKRENSLIIDNKPVLFVFGFRYLEAIREELTERNNLPDYRMPQDLGFTGYNKAWGTPDFSEICREKFHLK